LQHEATSTKSYLCVDRHGVARYGNFDIILGAISHTPFSAVGSEVVGDVPGEMVGGGSEVVGETDGSGVDSPMPYMTRPYTTPRAP